jgi:hypothetical protein
LRDCGWRAWCAAALADNRSTEDAIAGARFELAVLRWHDDRRQNRALGAPQFL